LVPEKPVLLLTRGMTLLNDIPICVLRRPMAFNQDVKALRPTSGLDEDFFPYLLLGHKHHLLSLVDLAGHGTGRLNTDELKSLIVTVPPLSEQRAIAHILGTLDDKIELNRKMNQTLEEMVQAIFKSWFVDFDPVRAKMEGHWRPGQSLPGLPADFFDLFPDRLVPSELGEIPEGWEVQCIEDLTALSREGLSPSDFPDEVFDHFSIPAYDEGCMPKAEMGAAIKSNKHFVLHDCVLLSKLNPRIPRIWLPSPNVTRRSICSTEFLVVFPKSIWTRDFLYCSFTSRLFMNKFATLVTGTSGSHQRVKPQAFMNLSVIAPSPTVVERFTSFVSSLLTRVAESREESRTLAALRDTILPKLIAGEIRIPEAEHIAEEMT